jgi:hypothetical protein
MKAPRFLPRFDHSPNIQQFSAAAVPITGQRCRDFLVENFNEFA